MPYPRAEVDAAIRGLAEAFKEAERTNRWAWIADKFYHPDCVYTCPYAGAILAPTGHGHTIMDFRAIGNQMSQGLKKPQDQFGQKQNIAQR